MKYRVGRKQKRVILDENGYEVAICHKGKEEVAKQICDLLNEHGLVSNTDLLHDVSQRSKLLIDYMKWFDNNRDMYYEVSNKEMIDEYFKSINGG